MVLTVSFVLSSVNRALLPPSQASMRKHCRPLDISVGISGPHDFAVRPKPRSSDAAGASIASRLNVRDDRERPSCRRRDGRSCGFDLPDETSKNACDTLARRANQSVARKSCQALTVIPGRVEDASPESIVTHQCSEEWIQAAAKRTLAFSPFGPALVCRSSGLAFQGAWHSKRTTMEAANRGGLLLQG